MSTFEKLYLELRAEIKREANEQHYAKTHRKGLDAGKMSDLWMAIHSRSIKITALLNLYLTIRHKPEAHAISEEKRLTYNWHREKLLKKFVGLLPTQAVKS